ncbi:MAG: hypothetical protein ABI171_23480 [Collimonas sp.]|uniref:hypothetical protein n=1 Tax=Collimonas sp. TaxID=1963772 RepID=UPI003265E9FB
MKFKEIKSTQFKSDSIDDDEYVQYKSTSNRLRARQLLRNVLVVIALGAGGVVIINKKADATVEPYCRTVSGDYSVGWIIRSVNGEYRECLQDSPTTPPYWGEEARSRSRPEWRI